MSLAAREGIITSPLGPSEVKKRKLSINLIKYLSGALMILNQLVDIELIAELTWATFTMMACTAGMLLCTNGGLKW